MADTATMLSPGKWTDNGEHVLILRRIGKDGKSYGGFDKWGAQSELDIEVSAPDWRADNTCGGGLHGWAWGMGIGEGCEYSIIDDRWLVLAARPDEVQANLEGGYKCKCARATKIYDGHFAGAWAMINSGRHRLIEAISKLEIADTKKTVASGGSSKLAASGYYSKLAASGDYSKLAASGYYSQLAASGYYSKLAASGGSSKLAASGDYSQLAASGYYSQLAASGKSSIAAAIAPGCEVAAGENGLMILTYWSASEQRFRAVVANVGEDGIKPNTRYKLNDEHQFVEA